VSVRPFRWPAALVAGLVILAFDQWSKLAVSGAFRYGEVRPVTSFFNLVLVHNTGAAFSFLAGAGGWQRGFFIAITCAAAALIVWMIRRHRTEHLFCWALVFILAGAVGNLVDRVAHGHVVDFLDFHYGGWHFWAFNLADSSITLGAGLLILDSVLRREPGRV
jgi:signal peptidase II